MPFLGIFSKSKKKKETKIIADLREKNSLVISELIEKGVKVEMKHLKVADYILGDIAIERKTARDFISSMINKRLERQLEEIKQYKNYFLIIEGNLNEVEFKNKNALRGMILEILLEKKIPILFSQDEEETATFLILLAKKSKKQANIRANKKILTKKEKLQYILEGFPGIGPRTAEKLLKKYKNLKTIFTTSIDELEKEIGKKARVFALLSEHY